MLNIEEIEQRLAKATPGPWQTVSYEDGLVGINALSDGDKDGIFTKRVLVINRKRDGSPAYRQQAGPDAAFIAHAPTDIAALLSELKSLREAADALCTYYAERGRAGDKEPMQVTNFRKAVS